ncbi:hypothetical protein AAG570_004324 [Ranatra chinensis]|uniref:Uncharacterized protein n=1 Tax=Ranatra chinensis TaxID=642074 RepID=A0ABD0Y0L1_9HEMI
MTSGLGDMFDKNCKQGTTERGINFALSGHLTIERQEMERIQFRRKSIGIPLRGFPLSYRIRTVLSVRMMDLLGDALARLVPIVKYHDCCDASLDLNTANSTQLKIEVEGRTAWYVVLSYTGGCSFLTRLVVQYRAVEGAPPYCSLLKYEEQKGTTQTPALFPYSVLLGARYVRKGAAGAGRGGEPPVVAARWHQGSGLPLQPPSIRPGLPVWHHLPTSPL